MSKKIDNVLIAGLRIRLGFPGIGSDLWEKNRIRIRLREKTGSGSDPRTGSGSDPRKNPEWYWPFTFSSHKSQYKSYFNTRFKKHPESDPTIFWIQIQNDFDIYPDRLKNNQLLWQRKKINVYFWKNLFHWNKRKINLCIVWLPFCAFDLCIASAEQETNSVHNTREQLNSFHCRNTIPYKLCAKHRIA